MSQENMESTVVCSETGKVTYGLDMFDHPAFASIRNSFTNKQNKIRFLKAASAIMPYVKNIEVFTKTLDIPANQACINFGKYKGKPISTLDVDYVRWIMNCENIPQTCKDFIWEHYPPNLKIIVNNPVEKKDRRRNAFTKQR